MTPKTHASGPPHPQIRWAAEITRVCQARDPRLGTGRDLERSSLPGFSKEGCLENNGSDSVVSDNLVTAGDRACIPGPRFGSGNRSRSSTLCRRHASSNPEKAEFS